MKILLTYALGDERVDVCMPHHELVYLETGVGKVRSAMNLMRAVIFHRPDLVLNFGTAGSLNHNVGDVVVCNRFVDRDLCRLVLGEVNSSIAFPPDILSILPDKNFIVGTCNTGDSFVTEVSDIEGDVIDMEASAQADVCSVMNLPFFSVKYVTDVVGQNSVDIWKDKLADARKSLFEFFNM